MEQNRDFINNDGFRCPLCGGVELIPSIVRLEANYGSREHDMERLTVHVCGSCIDKLFTFMEKHMELQTNERG